MNLYRYDRAITVAAHREKAVLVFSEHYRDHELGGFDAEHIHLVPLDEYVDIPLNIVSLKEHLRESEQAFTSALYQSFEEGTDLVLTIYLEAKDVPAIVPAGYVWDLQG